MEPSLHDMLASGKFERFQLHGPRVFWSPNFLERPLFYTLLYGIVVKKCRNVPLQASRVNRPRTEPQRSIAKKGQRQCCFLPCGSFWVGAYRYKTKINAINMFARLLTLIYTVNI